MTESIQGNAALQQKRAAFLAVPADYAGPTPVLVAYRTSESVIPSYLRYDDGGVIYFVAALHNADGGIDRAMSVQNRPSPDGERVVQFVRNMDAGDCMDALQAGAVVDTLDEACGRVLGAGLKAVLRAFGATGAADLDTDAIDFFAAAFDDAAPDWQTVVGTTGAADVAADLAAIGDALAAALNAASAAA